MRRAKLTFPSAKSFLILLELTRRGLERKAAYEAVQRAAMATWQGTDSLEVNLNREPSISSVLKPAEISKLCSLAVHLRHVDETFRKLKLI